MKPDFAGFGLGLRSEHYADFHAAAQPLDWLEIISENYLLPGGKPLEQLMRIRADYPMAMHGVSLSIGSTDPLDRGYLRQLRALADRVEPLCLSDHLCWTGVAGRNLHDLLPLPWTDEALAHVAERVAQVQDALGRRILLENVSSYATFRGDDYPEAQFLAALAERADCLILLDLNNVYVNHRNHGLDPHAYLAALPAERIAQFHLAGHQDHGNHLIDSHDAAIVDPVWQLYTEALGRFGPVSTMIERDDAIPPLNELIAELDIARRLAADLGIHHEQPLCA
ncbi:UPF0276 protein [Jeongeupia sp. HS-3]|uniref:MNIO family bufferin maturase n=1 Tax=Jeongeupia sp. HS-3 TaxID=1009682 RepID=UPI0018A5F5F0|nr:DUF692 domain-containing protein [Jeongeupia sp. HS-3]BCL76639.1 UPF0276 protein [Jeongeupia sp. HS-3]